MEGSGGSPGGGGEGRAAARWGTVRAAGPRASPLSLLSPQASFGSSSPVGSLSSEDHDFDPSAEMLVHDYDDERTLEEEELMEESKNFSSEIEDLEKEGNMPLEDLLAFYGYEPTIPVIAGSSADSSPSELADELPDMTLDKEEIAKDLLSGDDEETQSSADDLTPSVTSHEATDFFPRPLRSNTACDGDKESDVEDVEADSGNSSEDLRKEIMVGSQYQAEIPPYLGRYSDEEKAYENEDHLLWKPDVISENKVKEYLFETFLRTGNEKMIGRIPEGLHTRDNEQALYELLKSSHNVKEAIERYCSNGKASQEMTAWTEEECRSFEHALLIYGKDFHLIQKNKVRTRTVAECVAFYYMWKKSERYDYFAEGTGVVQSGEEKAQRWPHCSLQLPEEGKRRGRHRSLLPGNRWQDTREQHKAAPGEVQTGYCEKLLYHEGGQTQAS
uniref:MIER family member 3 n=1 Tax=Anser brachyrhynchus TaxID=132585 RepID=A0A8B9CVZ7_9AVES